MGLENPEPLSFVLKSSLLSTSTTLNFSGLSTQGHHKEATPSTSFSFYPKPHLIMTLSTLASKYSPNILAKLNHQKNNQASVKIDFFSF